MNRLKNKVVLVTASTRGIGYACVETCAREGAVVYMAARDMQRAREKVQVLAEQGSSVSAVYCDATQPETLAAMVEAVVQAEGRLDVLVNNFGTSDLRRDLEIEHTDLNAFLETVELNLSSVFIPAQAAVRHMKETGGGSIINISSIAGLVPDVTQIAYGTSKAAINYLTQLIAVQTARSGIRCNAVLPGMTATDAVRTDLTDSARELFLEHVPLGRMARPEEIAAAVVYLASDESAFTTGQILAVAGGFGLPSPVYGELIGSARCR